MAFVLGEVYVCPKEDCGCELTVTKAAPPTCCCGCTMVNAAG